MRKPARAAAAQVEPRGPEAADHDDRRLPGQGGGTEGGPERVAEVARPAATGRARKTSTASAQRSAKGISGWKSTLIRKTTG